jgi:ubiquinone/menaquinone biosynthesis C-methylase UbiE
MLVNGYAQFMSFENHSFNQVVATFPSEYIFTPQAVQEIYRILKSGGLFVMIPGAWITGKRWYERMAAGLFRVTGQAPAWDEHFAQPFREAGFQLQDKRIDLKSSSVLLLLAQKS